MYLAASIFTLGLGLGWATATSSSSEFMILCFFLFTYSCLTSSDIKINNYIFYHFKSCASDDFIEISELYVLGYLLS